MFHLMVTPTQSDFYILTYMVYADSTSDVFFIGDPDRVAQWTTGLVHIHDFRIYSGAGF